MKLRKHELSPAESRTELSVQHPVTLDANPRKVERREAKDCRARMVRKYAASPPLSTPDIDVAESKHARAIG